MPPLSIFNIVDREEELRARVRKIAEDKIGFYINLVIFLAMITFFIAMWLWSGCGFPWFVFPLVL